MFYSTKIKFLVAAFVLGLFITACNNSHTNTTTSSANEKQNTIVSDPEDMDDVAINTIQTLLQSAENNNGKLDESTQLSMAHVIVDFYKQKEYNLLWSKEAEWKPLADSLFNFITHAKSEGLFPNDYHFSDLTDIKNKLDKDSLARMDASTWSKADILLTDGLAKILKDLKYGRLQADSISLNKDSSLIENFYFNHLNEIIEKKQFTPTLTVVQPKHKGYWDLKDGIKRFLDSSSDKSYTYVPYPYKKGSADDSLRFTRALQKRLAESGCPAENGNLAEAIRKYQRIKGLTADGKVSTTLIKSMNTSDAEKFKRIAITLDKYKQMPEKMPEKYIWVNLPAFYLQVWENGEEVLYSKVICGKPETRTPLLNSHITDMITYPTWTVPTSIIVKQYLPRLRKNPNYLSRIGLKLINNKGEKVDPGSVSWGKYSRGIPFSVMQSSGDNNALGVMKFNFDNPFSVYLHDTNQRYLFKNDYRALSHGCVRVQEWEKLAFYIARNDSMNLAARDTLRYTADSIKNWIDRKAHKRILVKNQIPLFIRYFSCEGKDGKIKFYDDIYGEDKQLREKYFANK